MTENDAALPTLRAHKRLVGADRVTIGGKVRAAYLDDGLTVQAIADELGRSYGFVHRLLRESDVEMRGRGGARRGRRAK